MAEAHVTQHGSWLRRPATREALFFRRRWRSNRRRDVVRVPFPFMHEGKLQDLNPLIDAGSAFDEADFCETMTGLVVKDGHQYAWPYNYATTLIYYNTKMFRDLLTYARSRSVFLESPNYGIYPFSDLRHGKETEDTIWPLIDLLMLGKETDMKVLAGQLCTEVDKELAEL